jgi:hypothetical protein
MPTDTDADIWDVISPQARLARLKAQCADDPVQQVRYALARRHILAENGLREAQVDVDTLRRLFPETAWTDDLIAQAFEELALDGKLSKCCDEHYPCTSEAC